MSTENTPAADAVAQAKAEHDAAWAASHMLAQERRNREADLDDEFVAPAKAALYAAKDKVSDILAREFNERTRAAYDRVQASERALGEACVAAASGDPRIGRTFVEWEVRRPSWSAIERRAFPTGRRAIVEVFGPDSPYPGNASQYSRPTAGAIVLRLFRKDGKPGAVVIALATSTDTYRGLSWLPEGERHPQATDEGAR